MAAVSGLTLAISSGSNGASITAGGNSTFAAVSATAPKVSTDWAVVGTRSMRCTTTTADTTYGRLDGASATTRYHGGPIRLRSKAGGTTILAQIEDNSINVKAQIQRLSDGTFRLRHVTTAVPGTTSAYIPDATDAGETGEYWLAIQVTGASFRAFLYPLGSSTPIWDSGNQTYSAGAFTRLRLGFISSVANSDVEFSAGWSADDSAPVAQPVTVPTVDAGPDKAADVATKVSIDATITNGSGTQAWTRISGPAVTFSAASSVDTDVTNTSGVAGTTVCRLTDGSSFDEVSIVWSPLPTTAGVAGIESAGSWTDTANLLDDDPDTGATITNASASPLGLRLKNRTTPTGAVNIKLRGVVQSGSHTVDISLRKHNKSTVVKAVTGVTIVNGVVTIPLTSGDISSMGSDWATQDGWGAYLVVTATAV